MVSLSKNEKSIHATLLDEPEVDGIDSNDHVTTQIMLLLFTTCTLGFLIYLAACGPHFLVYSK